MIALLLPAMAFAAAVARSQSPAPLPEGVVVVPGAEESQTAATGQPFGSYLLVDASGATYREPLRIQRLIESLQAMPFRNVVVQVRAYGDAYYNSDIVPKSMGVAAEVDPLAELIRGLKTGPEPKSVYAWLDLYRVADVNRPVPLAPNHVLNLHPDWLSLNVDFETEDPDGNQYLEPGLQGVQDHVVAIVQELARRYEIDGVLLEGLRYPGYDARWGYHPDLIDAWRRETGQEGKPAPDDERWRQMRRDWIDRNLLAISRGVEAVNPGVDVMAVALAEGPAPATVEEFQQTPVYQGALQNWPEWIEEGLVDELLMENYRDEAAGAEDFDAWNRFASQLVQENGVEIVPAVAGWQNLSIDALSQLRRAQKAGLAGAALSNYREPIRDAASQDLFMRALAKTVFAPTSERLPFPAPEPADETQIAALPQDGAAAGPGSVATDFGRPDEADEEAVGLPAPGMPAPGDQQQTTVDIPPPPVLPDGTELPEPLPPPSQLPPAEEQPEDMLPEDLMTGEEAPEETVVASGPEDLLEDATSRLARRNGGFIEPPTQAVEFLKTKYPNIF